LRFRPEISRDVVDLLVPELVRARDRYKDALSTGHAGAEKNCFGGRPRAPPLTAPASGGAAIIGI